MPNIETHTDTYALKRELEKQSVLSEAAVQNNNSSADSEIKNIFINLDLLSLSEDVQSKKAIFYLSELLKQYPSENRFKRGNVYEIKIGTDIVRIVLLQSLIQPDKREAVYFSLAAGKGPDSVLGQGGFGKVKHSKKKFSIINNELHIENIEYVAKIGSDPSTLDRNEYFTKLTHTEVENTQKLTQQKVYGPMVRYFNANENQSLEGKSRSVARVKTTFFMPKVPGVSLHEFITKFSNNKTGRNFEKIIENCLKGLQKIHKAGYVHRDIKSENIMIDPVTLDVKFIDFAFSEKIGMNSHAGSEALRDKALEIINDDLKTYEDPVKADIFNLGVVFVQLLTKNNYVIFETRDTYSRESNLPNKQTQNRNDQNYNLSSLDSSPVSKGIIDMIKGMVNNNPVARPSTVENCRVIALKFSIKEFIETNLIRISKPGRLSKTFLHNNQITENKKTILQQAKDDVDKASSLDDIKAVIQSLNAHSKELTESRYSFFGLHKAEVKIEKPLNDLVDEVNRLITNTDSMIKPSR